MHPPEGGDTWLGLVDGPLPVAAATEWVVQPSCGAVVLFSGTARDHSADVARVTGLAYEAYAGRVEPRLAAIADDARARWPVLGRIAMLHRTGPVAVGESSVVVAVSAPHRAEAFAAARFCIDTLKATAPIWKQEQWDGGSRWVEEGVAHADGSMAP